MAVVSPLIKDWRAILGDFINVDMVDNMRIRVTKVHTERDNKNTGVHHLIKLDVEGQEVTVTCYDTRLSMMVQRRAPCWAPSAAGPSSPT